MQKIRPILFSTPMLQAILEGRKTMTRRLVKDPIKQWAIDGEKNEQYMNRLSTQSPNQIGDILWVRETFNTNWNNTGFIYRADEQYPAKNTNFWKPCLFMPKQACRIWLEVTNVRLERLQDISEMDAIAEGVIRLNEDDIPTYLFQKLWQSINGANSWEEDPWVWVYEFKQVEMPINFLN
jgi:hypothetical protein